MCVGFQPLQSQNNEFRSTGDSKLFLGVCVSCSRLQQTPAIPLGKSGKVMDGWMDKGHIQSLRGKLLDHCIALMSLCAIPPPAGEFLQVWPLELATGAV